MNKRMQSGFTLVELLIVMAIIAILAVGVLVGLNPVEQINKAKDTKSAQISGELFEAIQRWTTNYSTNSAANVYPWSTSGVGTVMRKYTFTDDGTPALTSGINSPTDKLISSGELKASTYTEVNANANIWVGGNGGTAPVVCYAPISSAARGGLAAGQTKFQGFTYKKLNAPTGIDPNSSYAWGADPTAASDCTVWVDGANPFCVLCMGL